MRLIDADKLRSDIIEKMSFLKSAEENLEIMGGCIDDATTVDAVEVVRCEDCRYWVYKQKDEIAPMCVIFEHFPRKDFYCEFGEKRAGNDEP